MEDTIGTQLAVLYAVEPLYRGHHWDPAGCPVYSGTSLWRTPLGPSWLSCMQWNLSTVDTIGTQLAVLYREVSLIQRQLCTQFYVVGTADSVLIREVSLIQSALYREVPLYLVFSVFLSLPCFPAECQWFTVF